MARRPIIVGNWKMHKTRAESLSLASEVMRALGGLRDIDVGITPPYFAVPEVAARLRDSKLIVAAQNCHFESKGAFTGEVAPQMVRDAGASHVLVGHSERRQYFGEDDDIVNKKVKAAFEAGLSVILCIGERLSEREGGQTNDVVKRQLTGGLSGIAAEQLDRLVVAYEPVWAIGTGKTATAEQAQEVHKFLRDLVGDLYNADVAAALRIQYGGSVKPGNITSLMAQPDVDGALVGGASLTADAFIGILKFDRSASAA